MSDNGLRSHLTLVYSASTGRFSSEPKDDTLASKKDVAWQQIELFASERSDTVIYASPENCRLSSLLELVQSAHIRQIFDFRDIPHLAFEGGTRASFFEALLGLKVRYFSSLAFETMGQTRQGGGAIEVLTQRIEKGPTIVFSELRPDLDPDIQEINLSLNRRGVHFKPVFLTLKDERPQSSG